MAAIIEAGGRRLRPSHDCNDDHCGHSMAYGSAATSGISYTPMGRVVAGGLFAGTLLTPFFVPLLYLIDTTFVGIQLGFMGQRLSQGATSAMEES